MPQWSSWTLCASRQGPPCCHVKRRCRMKISFSMVCRFFGSGTRHGGHCQRELGAHHLLEAWFLEVCFSQHWSPFPAGSRHDGRSPHIFAFASGAGLFVVPCSVHVVCFLHNYLTRSEHRRNSAGGTRCRSLQDSCKSGQSKRARDSQ